MNQHIPIRREVPRNEVPMTSEEIIEKLKALGPLIEAEADEVNRQRHLTKPVLDALREAGAFRIAWPAAWGGPEMRFEDQVRAVEALAYHDASVAWNVQILSDTGFYGGQFPEPVARELYDSMDFATAGGFYPPSRADEVEGGWTIVKGRWPFGSGIHSADRIVCGITLHRDGKPILDAEGQPEFRVAYLPVDKVKLLDTWYTLGLRGSGSTDYEAEDVFVPDRHVFKFFNGEATHLPPLSRYADLVAISLQGVILGLGRRVLDDVQAALRKRSPNDRYTRIHYAEAEASYRAARSYVFDVATRLSDRLFSGALLTKEEQSESNLCSVFAGHEIVKACNAAMELLGAATMYERSPFERRRRDMQMLLAHISHQRKSLEVSGGQLLGEGNLPRYA